MGEAPFDIELILDFIDAEGEVVLVFVLQQMPSQMAADIVIQMLFELLDPLHLLAEHLLIHTFVHDLIEGLQADDLPLG